MNKITQIIHNDIGLTFALTVGNIDVVFTVVFNGRLVFTAVVFNVVIVVTLTGFNTIGYTYIGCTILGSTWVVTVDVLAPSIDTNVVLIPVNNVVLVNDDDVLVPNDVVVVLIATTGTTIGGTAIGLMVTTLVDDVFVDVVFVVVVLDGEITDTVLGMIATYPYISC